MKQISGKNTRFPEWLFYSNFFYGICTVALSIEATLQQHFPLTRWYYYAVVLLATVLYYNYPYARQQKNPADNPRTAWYIRHNRLLRLNQLILTFLLVLAGLLFFYHHPQLISQLDATQWLLLLLFPAIAALYYGINILSTRYNLRSIGWLKPFIIGFTWAGVVTVYPILWHNLLNEQAYTFTLQGVLLFIKNMMFISLLCIMFDIKDYAADHRGGLKTFVVQLGLRKTIFAILLPLAVFGLLTFLTYALTHGFHTMKILLNTIPFILLVFAAASLRRRRSMLYYHTVIDGLMLVKATCGTMAMLFF